MSTPAHAAGQPAEPSAPEAPNGAGVPETPAEPGTIPESADTKPTPQLSRFAHIRLHLPTVPEAFASLLRTIIVALFVLTFLLQPQFIPSESMEHTLLVGDFLLVNKQIFAPAGPVGRRIMPYRDVERGDIVLFHHPYPPLLIKRAVGLPGDRIHIENGRVFVNGDPLNEPYATFEPVYAASFLDNFPARIPNPDVDPTWWHKMRSMTQNGEITVPPGQYFVLGDNRNYSKDSRFWGFVPRQAIVARPVVIYFSLTRPSGTDVEQASDDRLNHDRELSARLAGFARWKRIFRIVH
jgi:signal peptidase I